MPRTDPKSPPNVPPALPPLSLGADPSQQHPLPAPPVTQTMGQSHPQLPSLNFDSSLSQVQSRPVDSSAGHALTPITELNSARGTPTDFSRAPGPSLSTDQSHGSQQHASESDEHEPLSKFVAASVIFDNEDGSLVLGRPTASSSPPPSGTSRKLSGDSFGRGAGSRPDSKLSPNTENTTTKSQETFGSGMGVAEVMGVKLPFSPLASPESPSFSTNSSMSVRSPTSGNHGPTLQSPGSPGSPGKPSRSLRSSPSYSIMTSPHSLLEKDLPSIQALQTAQSFSSPPSRSLMRSPSNTVPPVPDKPMSPFSQSTPVSRLTPAPPPADPQSVFTDALFFMQQFDEKTAPPRRVPTTISEKSDSTSVSEPSFPAHTPLSGAASPSQRSGVGSEPSLSGSRIALGRKPSGARALTTSSGTSRGLNPDASSLSSPEQQHLLRAPDSDTDTMSDHDELQAAPPPRKGQLEDVNADALAALSFLDVDTVAIPAPSKQPTASTSAGDAVRPPPPRPQPSPQPTENLSPAGSSDNVAQYKSTFAPSKQAVQRKARLQAQQAAHQAAVNRPGRANGKRGSNSRVSGWNETSDEDEEEEEEEEEEEDADSDDEPSATGSKRPSQTSVHAPSPVPAPIGGTQTRPLRPHSRTQSPAEVPTATDANPYAQLRHPRGLPPVPRPQTQGDFSFHSVSLS